MRRASTPPIRPVVLAVVEASPSGDLAWREACTRTRRNSGVVIALRVLPPRSATIRADAPAGDPEVVRVFGARVEARQELQRLVDDASGVEAEVAVAEGSPIAEVAVAASEKQATMVVLGDYGDRPGMRLAATAEGVLQRTRASVLVVRPGLHTGIVLAACDFSEGWDAVVGALAAEAVVRVAASPILAHVVEAPFLEKTVGGDVGHRLLQALASKRVAGEAIVMDGDPAHAIVGAAEDADAELVIVGSVGRGARSTARLGAVAERVLRHARCSVLVVPMARA
jgi:nucleotide-binding universal stress UspA family protein